MFKIALYIYTSVDFKKYSAPRSAIVTAQYMLLLDRDGRKISKGSTLIYFSNIHLLLHNYTLICVACIFYLQYSAFVIWNGGMVFNATFNTISVISLWSFLLMEETGVPRKNHRPATSL